MIRAFSVRLCIPPIGIFEGRTLCELPQVALADPSRFSFANSHDWLKKPDRTKRSLARLDQYRKRRKAQSSRRERNECSLQTLISLLDPVVSIRQVAKVRQVGGRYRPAEEIDQLQLRTMAAKSYLAQNQSFSPIQYSHSSRRNSPGVAIALITPSATSK